MREKERVCRRDALTEAAGTLEISGFGGRGGMATAVEVIELDSST